MSVTEWIALATVLVGYGGFALAIYNLHRTVSRQAVIDVSAPMTELRSRLSEANSEVSTLLARIRQMGIDLEQRESEIRALQRALAAAMQGTKK